MVSACLADEIVRAAGMAVKAAPLDPDNSKLFKTEPGAGVLVVEQVFGWPGIGQYIAQSIPVADFPAIAGVTLMLGALYVVINTVVDLLQAAADPRIAVTGG